MKLLQIVLVFSAILAVAFAANASWGTRYNNGSLASSQNLVKNKLANQFQSFSISFPANGQVNTRKIQYINVTDRFTNSSGPTATLWSGGVGFTYAQINFKTQYGQGLNVTTQFWVNP